jgi:hypothetical protein
VDVTLWMIDGSSSSLSDDMSNGSRSCRVQRLQNTAHSIALFVNFWASPTVHFTSLASFGLCNLTVGISRARSEAPRVGCMSALSRTLEFAATNRSRCISFLFLTGFEQLNHLGYARVTRFRPFGALDPSNIVLAIEGRQRIEESLGFWFGVKCGGDIG